MVLTFPHSKRVGLRTSAPPSLF